MTRAPADFRRVRRSFAAAVGSFVIALGVATHAQAAVFSALGYAAPVPDVWLAEPPSNQFRLAQYRVPGRGGDAEVVVYYFGQAQGGSVAANIQRWTSQFTAADGRPVTPKTSVLKVADLAVTLVELNGSYARGIGSGPQGQARPDQTLLVAIVQTAAGSITMQLHGPHATVAAHRKQFDAMVRGLRKAD